MIFVDRVFVSFNYYSIKYDDLRGQSFCIFQLLLYQITTAALTCTMYLTVSWINSTVSMFLNESPLGTWPLRERSKWLLDSAIRFVKFCCTSISFYQILGFHKETLIPSVFFSFFHSYYPFQKFQKLF